MSDVVNHSARWIIRRLKCMCLVFTIMIFVEIVAGAMRVGPPPVPLDTEGHMAPYPDFLSWSVGWPERIFP